MTCVETYSAIGGGIDRQPENPHHSRTLPQSAKATGRAARVTRDEVWRILQSYFGRDYSAKSASGRLAIDDDRAETPFRMWSSGSAEFVSQLRAIYLNSLANQPAPPRNDVRSESTGEPLHCVAARRDVAMVVRGRARRGATPSAPGSLDRMATIGQKLARLTLPEREALERSAELRDLLVKIRNILQAQTTKVQRSNSGKRARRRGHGRPTLDETQLAALGAAERSLSAELATLVRTKVHIVAFDRAVEELTRTEQIARDVFGEEW